MAPSWLVENLRIGTGAGSQPGERFDALSLGVATLALQGRSVATAAERDRIVREFKKALAESGVKVPMATTNLFGDPVFRDGAFTSNDRQVRTYALQKTMRAMDLGAEMGT